MDNFLFFFLEPFPNRPGVAGAVLQTPLFLINYAQMVGNGALSHKIYYITIFEEILNLKRTLKLHYWFKSYGDFAECVDFSYWTKLWS